MGKRSMGAVACVVLLTSCTGVSSDGILLGLGFGGRHVGVGTSMHFPLGSRAGVEDRGGLRIIEERVVTFFDANGSAVSSAVKGGFYRQLLGGQNRDGYLVQDFYDTGEKRSDPMRLTRDKLYDFRAHPRNGVLTVYAINGNILYQQNFRDGKMISASYGG